MAYGRGRPSALKSGVWIPLQGVWVLQPDQAAAGPALRFWTGSGALLGDRRRSMRRAPWLTPAGVHWVWSWEPEGPSAPVPEEWLIPPRHGPLALCQAELLLDVVDMEVVVEVDSLDLDPDQQRAATAFVCCVLQTIFIAVYDAFFQQQFLTWAFFQAQGGQFVRSLLLLRGTVSCSCLSSLSICFCAPPCFISVAASLQRRKSPEHCVLFSDDHEI